jgi:FtsZ-binding cell division protein ZapB
MLEDLETRVETSTSQRTQDLLSKSDRLQKESAVVKQEAQSALDRLRDVLTYLAESEIDLANIMQNRRRR